MGPIDLALVVLTAIIAAIFLPMNVGQVVLFYVNRLTDHRRRDAMLYVPRVPGRRVLVLITTNGKAAEVVEDILRTLRGYALPILTGVVKEEADPREYSSDLTISVPRDYACPNGSRFKMRAQHYGAKWLGKNGFGAETYVVHLDDDTLPSLDYLEYVFRMIEPAGQGCLRLRSHGKHLLSTLADMARVSNCDAYCAFFNARGRPMEVHGEGLVIRADLETELGWDFGTFGAEDLMMGQRIVSMGLGFGYIPEHVYIAPPTSTHDFFVQRRRWLMSVLWSWKEIGAIRKNVLRWVIYRHSMSWLGVVGMGLLAINLLAQTPVPLWLDLIGIVNLIGFFAFYQYGAYRTDPRRYSIKMAALQLPVSIYECATFVFGMLRPPDRWAFETIHKV